MQVSAKLADASRTIKASFFFGVKEIPNGPDVGSKVRLIGTHLQQWKQGGLQLCGKNIQFGESIVSMSLSNAITAWGIVKAAGAQSCFPKLSMTAVVIAWGRADTCRGSDMHLSAEFRDFDNVNCTIRGSFFVTLQNALDRLILEMLFNLWELTFRNGTVCLNFLDEMF